MKDIQKAIAHFKYGVDCDIFNEPVTSYAKSAIAALKKQIPHKLAPKTIKGYEVPVCGKCNGIMDLMQGELNYCPNCGQALDWSDTE